MAVYTEVADGELAAFVARFGIGELLAAKGIAEGVENSNYFIHTSDGFFILTLYEKRVSEADLPFFLGLMAWVYWPGRRDSYDSAAQLPFVGEMNDAYPGARDE